MNNSYYFDHQKNGSEHFCQTYAILYMLGHNNVYMKKKFTDKLNPGINNYSNNIKVVVSFWRYMFNFSKPLKEWMINEVKSINNYYKGVIVVSIILCLILDNKLLFIESIGDCEYIFV